MTCDEFGGTLNLIHFNSVQTPPSVVTELNSTELCHVFRSLPDLKMVVQSLGLSPLKFGANDCLISGSFMTASLLARECLYNSTSYTQTKKLTVKGP